MDFKPAEGFATIEEEFEARIRKAFVEKRAHSVWIHSSLEGFQIAMASFGKEKGWLEGELLDLDSQSSAMSFKLTEAGRKYFGLE